MSEHSKEAAELAAIHTAMLPLWRLKLSASAIVVIENALSAAVGLPVTTVPPGWSGGLVVRVHDGATIRRYVPTSPFNTADLPDAHQTWWQKLIGWPA